MRALDIDGFRVEDEGDPFVIAEIGHNHQGQMDVARQLFEAAAEAGANAVKLQKRSNRDLYTRDLYESTYDNRNSYGDTYGAHREALEFGRTEYQELMAYAAELGLLMFSTPFDMPSVDFLEDLGVGLYKTASGDLKNTPLLDYIARTGKPLLISTGGGTMDDVQRAHDTVRRHHGQLAILQCTASYPADPADMNLRVITAMRDRFPDVVVGLSDHQSGISMALVAFVLGARVFEKHFTLNRALKGTDHAFSLEPVGLRKLVRDLKRARLALGDGEKRPLGCEEAPLRKMGKMLVAARDLPARHVLAREDVGIKSPGAGLPPYELDAVLGRRLARALHADEALRHEDLADA